MLVAKRDARKASHTPGVYHSGDRTGRFVGLPLWMQDSFPVNQNCRHPHLIFHHRSFSQIYLKPFFNSNRKVFHKFFVPLKVKTY